MGSSADLAADGVKDISPAIQLVERAGPGGCDARGGGLLPYFHRSTLGRFAFWREHHGHPKLRKSSAGE